jgi:hypothetical protein
MERRGYLRIHLNGAFRPGTQSTLWGLNSPRSQDFTRPTDHVYLPDRSIETDVRILGWKR